MIKRGWIFREPDRAKPNSFRPKVKQKRILYEDRCDAGPMVLSGEEWLENHGSRFIVAG
jgi:hypothetical protein